ncbi:MAG: hypothetical protein Q9209_001305 [Squamulea sp. 1 TL-2023]
MAGWEDSPFVWAAQQPRNLQQGTFYETSRGLAMVHKTQAPNSVFSGYHQPRDYPPRFVPQLNIEAVELQRRLIIENLSVSTALPTPVFDSTYGFAEPAPSAGSPVNARTKHNTPYAQSRRLESEYIRFEASMRRLCGETYRHTPQNPLWMQPSLKSGVQCDNQNGENVLKRGREESPQIPVKRTRHSKQHKMMSDRSDRNQTFYGGPYLERLEPHQQESYTHLETLATGGQGTAHLLQTRRTGSLVVCKVIPHTRSYKKHDPELSILRDALPRHPRIISLRSALVSPLQTQLYLDYCSGGDLSSFIEAYHSHSVPCAPWGYSANYIPESFIWHTFLQLTEALAFIHYGYNRTTTSSHQIRPDKWLGVIHRDIKPCNIFLQRAPSHPDHPGPEPYPKIVLADFGLAKKAEAFKDRPTSDEWLGTYIWQPPELPHHSAKGDMWSAGAIMFLMMAGYIPTEDLPDRIENPSLVGNLWKQALTAEKGTSRRGTGMRGYSKGLEWCLKRALAAHWNERMSSLQLFCEIENCRDRVSAGWKELLPWVKGG